LPARTDGPQLTSCRSKETQCLPRSTTTFFDASDTTHSSSSIRPWQDLLYEWDFDDPNSGVWAVSGEPKNQALGAVAGHVFDAPGNYNVQVTITDPSGASTTRSVAIQVTDPDVIYSGANTTCVSASGDFSGCPSGARRVTSSDFNGALGSEVRTGQRVLFRRGDNFTAAGKTARSLAGPVTIGAYGSGPRPVIRRSNAKGATIELSSPKAHLSDWRIMDLEFHGNLQEEVVVSGRSRMEDVLIQRLKIVDFATALFFFGSILQFDGLQPHSGVFFVENDAHRSGRPAIAGAYPFTLMGKHSALLGNTSTNVGSPTHIFRSDGMMDSVIQHNDLRDPEPSRLCIKLHAPGWHKGYGYTEDVIISSNFLRQGKTTAITAGPQNVTSDERLRRILVERNHFTFGGSSLKRTGVEIAADDSTVRNNLFDLSGDGKGGRCVWLRHFGAEPIHSGNEVLHNTCYDSDSTSSNKLVLMAGPGRAVGNLMVAPNIDTPTAGTNRSVLDNVTLTKSPFVTAPPLNRGDFLLKAGSSAIDTSSTDVVVLDAGRGVRPVDGNGDGVSRADAGAFEFGAKPGGGGGGAPSTPPAAPILLR
jgi:hypothetical protein